VRLQTGVVPLEVFASRTQLRQPALGVAFHSPDLVAEVLAMGLQASGVPLEVLVRQAQLA